MDDILLEDVIPASKFDNFSKVVKFIPTWSSVSSVISARISYKQKTFREGRLFAWGISASKFVILLKILCMASYGGNINTKQPAK